MKTVSQTSQSTSLRMLIDACPHMRRIHDLGGYPPPREQPAGFATLLRIIVDQQVSTQSGAAIWRRLEEDLGDVTVDAVLNTGEEGLRASGFSRPKARYAGELARAIKSGELDLVALEHLPTPDVQAALVKIKGIGRWTAEVYLMFALNRPDVWPAGDLALVVAVQHLLDLPARPNIDEMDALSQQWRPWRSMAALMLWHYYRHIKKGQGGEPGRS